MAGGRRRADDGLDLAQIGGHVRIAEAGQETGDGLESSFDLKTQHASKAGHLPPGNLVARMALQARIVDAVHLWLLLQEARQSHRILVVPLHAQAQRLQAAQHQKGGTGVHRGAGELAVAIDPLHQILAAADHAAQHVPVPTQELGCAVDDEVGAQGNGGLVDGCGKGVINDGDRPCLASGRGQTGQIEHLERGVGGRLQVQHVAALLNGGLNRLVVLRFTDTADHAKAGQYLREVQIRRAVGIPY